MPTQPLIRRLFALFAAVFVLFAATIALAQTPDPEFLDPAVDVVGTLGIGGLLGLVQAYGLYLYRKRDLLKAIDTWREVGLLAAFPPPAALLAYFALAALDGPIPTWGRVVIAVAVGFVSALKANSKAIGEGDGTKPARE